MTGAWVIAPAGVGTTAMRSAAAAGVQAWGKAYGVDFHGGWDMADEICRVYVSARPAVPEDVIDRIALGMYLEDLSSDAGKEEASRLWLTWSAESAMKRPYIKFARAALKALEEG